MTPTQTLKHEKITQLLQQAEILIHTDPIKARQFLTIALNQMKLEFKNLKALR